MPELGPHAGFIIAAYGLAIAVLAGLIGWVLIDRARQRQALALLEAQGVTRRSRRAGGAEAVRT